MGRVVGMLLVDANPAKSVCAHKKGVASKYLGKLYLHLMQTQQWQCLLLNTGLTFTVHLHILCISNNSKYYRLSVTAIVLLTRILCY